METLSSLAAPLTLVLLLTWLVMRWRSRQSARSSRREALDTVADWPPEAARVLSITERQAYDLLKRAMPGYLVLGQVPLSRFVRVPARHSYGDWLQRVGSLSADLLICDSGSRVLAVIDIRNPEESARSSRRHERMARVLRAANIRVHEWREGQLPRRLAKACRGNATASPVQTKPHKQVVDAAGGAGPCITARVLSLSKAAAGAPA
jgi:hypothetical protein